MAYMSTEELREQILLDASNENIDAVIRKAECKGVEESLNIMERYYNRGHPTRGVEELRKFAESFDKT